MFKNLNGANRNYLLHLSNIILKSSFCPDHWKSAIVVPILKAGKNPQNINSYRLISLTSCLKKVFERILKFRLQWHLEWAQQYSIFSIRIPP